MNHRHNNLTIGFTYDLKDDYLAMGLSSEEAAEFDSLETIEGVSDALRSLGYNVDLIGNAHSLISRLQKGDRWDLVFNICEGLRGIGREAQVPAILDLFNIPYVFSDVLVLSLTLHKGMTKHVIRDHGIPTAPFFVAHSLDCLENHSLRYPLFVKPVAEGTGKGIGPDSIVSNHRDLIRVGWDRLQRFEQSLLVEEFLPGREVTVGIVGTGSHAKVIGMMEVLFKKQNTSAVYCYQVKAQYEDFVDYVLPEKRLYDACCRVALDAWRALGCRDGGRIDLRLDQDGIPNFIEVNPLAGLNPIHSDLPILSRIAGISYEQLIGLIMNSALNREKLPVPSKSSLCRTTF